MDLNSSLMFEDSWDFLDLWVLVLVHPNLNWGSKLDFYCLGLSLWDLGPGSSLGSCSINLGSRGSSVFVFNHDLWG